MTNPTSNTDSPSQRGAGLPGSPGAPGAPGASGALPTQRPTQSRPQEVPEASPRVPGTARETAGETVEEAVGPVGAVGTGGHQGTLGAAAGQGAGGYSLEAVEALERRCDELQAQVVSLQAAAVVRAGIIKDQAERIHRTDELLAQANARLRAGSVVPPGAVRVVLPAARLVRRPARMARRGAGALVRRVRGLRP